MRVVRFLGSRGEILVARVGVLGFEVKRYLAIKLNVILAAASIPSLTLVCKAGSKTTVITIFFTMLGFVTSSGGSCVKGGAFGAESRKQCHLLFYCK